MGIATHESMRGEGIAAEFAQFGEVLQPRPIAEYLASQEWACLAKKPFGQLWAKASRPTAEVASVILPDIEASDYTSRFNETLVTLTKILHKSPAELAEAVASVRADLFFIRVDQSMSDGTIPLKQASQLLDSIDRMIKSAAIATANPTHAGRGRVPEVVKDFMDDDVRMGHTKRGSFIITVAARHDQEDASTEPVVKPGQTTSADDPLEGQSFSRRVMTTLSRSLRATKQHIALGDDFVSLDEAVVAGVRAPLIDALAGMGNSEGLRNIDLSFEWSVALPEPDIEDEHIIFSREEIGKMEGVSTRLKRDYSPQEETLVGQVTELKRPEIVDPSEDGGEVVMRADIEGRMRNVRLDLTGSQYDTALGAHRARMPIMATGVLSKPGRSWTLSGDLTVSRIEHQATAD